jgi:hypothetical protein
VEGPGTLVVKGRAGMGNRVMSVLTGIAYARLTGRHLVVDWRDKTYSEDGSNAFPLLFDCPRARPVATIPSTDSVAPSIWRGHLDASVVQLEHLHPDLGEEFTSRSTIEPRLLAYPEEVAVLWLYYSALPTLVRRHPMRTKAEFGSRAPRAIQAALARQELALVDDLRKRVDDFRARHLNGAEVVGVHIRSGRKPASVAAIRARLEDVVRRRPQARVFLSTDGSEVLDELGATYPQLRSTPHWYPPVGQDAHQNPRCPDRLENGREALVDLHLLAGCDELIIDSTSSFARLAQLLAGDSTTVHDVRQRHRRRSSRAPSLRLPSLAGLFSEQR